MEHRWESICLFQTLPFQFSLAIVHALSSFIIESDVKYPVGDCEAEGLVEPLIGPRELDPWCVHGAERLVCLHPAVL